MRLPIRTVASLALLIVLGLAGCAQRVVRSGESMPGNYGFFVFELKLSECPPAALPRSSSTEGTRIVAGYHDGPYCHGFTKYLLSRQQGGSTRETSPIYLHIKRASTCIATVALPTPRLCSERTLEQCPDYQHSFAITDFFLQLLFKGMPVGHVPSPVSTQGAPDSQAFKRWCEQRAQSTYEATVHPAFRKLAPEAPPEPNVD